MLRIRLTRIGKKNAPVFRVVLTEKTAPPKGRFLEILGSYDPRLKKTTLNKERILHWLSKGAKASDTVFNLMVSHGIIKGAKIKKKIKIKDKKKDQTGKPEEPEQVKEKKLVVEKEKEPELEIKGKKDKKEKPKEKKSIKDKKEDKKDKLSPEKEKQEKS